MSGLVVEAGRPPWPHYAPIVRNIDLAIMVIYHFVLAFRYYMYSYSEEKTSKCLFLAKILINVCIGNRILY